MRVEKDINRKSGLWWLALYYRRSRRFDGASRFFLPFPLLRLVPHLLYLHTLHSVPYITSIAVVKSSKDLPSGFVLSSGDDLHSGAWPRLPGLLLAYKLKNPPDDSLDGIPVEEEEVVTEIDVLFGEGEVSPRASAAFCPSFDTHAGFRFFQPWFGFQRVEPRILEKSSRHPESVGLTVRMEVPCSYPFDSIRDAPPSFFLLVLFFKANSDVLSPLQLYHLHRTFASTETGRSESCRFVSSFFFFRSLVLLTIPPSALPR